MSSLRDAEFEFEYIIEKMRKENEKRDGLQQSDKQGAGDWCKNNHLFFILNPF